MFALSLPMKQDFAISGGTVGDKSRGAPHVYVRVTSDDGAEGWGEARPSPRWSYETPETVASTIDRYLKPALLGMDAVDLQAVHSIMNREIKPGYGSGQPIAKAAVDMALHDLIGCATGRRLADMWFAGFRPGISLSYLISTPDPAEAERKASDAKRKGYRGVDVKLGLDPAADADILEAVKGAAPDLFFRADANQAYTLQQAVKLAKRMERLGVDVFEQPLRANDLFGHAELRRKTSVPVALDESIWTAGDLVQAIRAEACDTVVVKVTKMGGLSGAKRCGELAREAGLGLLGGGLTESRLGLAASAHLFNCLGITEPADLNGPLFLEDDPVEEGPTIDEGSATLPDRPGIGCRISTDKLQAFFLK
ncbi:mandelate racemase/muconate lactonizing enzyme family protein [Cohnella zeiphila]|uniref:mandelate racemase/muconate lactonizing enzyme family protein n=1 Tax=Cohnella zeiphila TaxID=2761120 RepID=UPI003080DF1E